MTSARTPEQTPAWERRGRAYLWVLLGLGIVAMTLLATVLGPPGPEGSAVEIELARDAAGFAEAFRKGWAESTDTLCGLGADYTADGKSFGTLRCHLLVDSIGLVPGYAGLLIFLTALLHRVGRVRSNLLKHVLCVPAAAAGLFDIAENGMTVIAAEDLVAGLLADATVADVRLASLLKWSIVAVAFAVLALLAWRAAGREREGKRIAWPLQAAAVAAASGAALIAAGIAGSWNGLLAPGMLPAIVALALLAWWRLRKFDPAAHPFPTPPRPPASS
jgi:hypothetical protein